MFKHISKFKTIFFLYILVQNVESDLLDPYYKEIEDLDWVKILEVNPNGMTIQIREETIHEEKQILFFRVDDNSPPKITSTGDGNSLEFFKISDNEEENEDEEFRLFGLELKKMLDREAITPAEYKIVLSHGNSLIIITVEIQDINDNDPRFTPAGPFTVKENCTEECFLSEFSTNFNSRGFNIFVFTGTDLDDDLQKLSFSAIENGAVDREQFIMETEINNKTNEAYGLFSINGTLDYEYRTMHQVVVKLTDGERTVDQTVIVHVHDIPDEFPIWRRLPLVTNIDEHTENKFLFKIEAVDGDRGVNSPILYTMEGFNEDNSEDPRVNEYFQLNENTGDFHIIKEIDAEHDDFFNRLSLYIRVFASEVFEPKWSINESITINIRDINDQTPVFYHSGNSIETFKVLINEACTDSSNVVGCFTDSFLNLPTPFIIRDMDTAQNFGTYTAHINGSEFVNEALAISPTSGSQETEFQIAVIDRTKLDYENIYWRNSVQFEVIIKEVANSTHEAKAIIIVTLNDLNDNSPNFEDTENGEYKLAINETVGNGEIIITVFANDNDVSSEFGKESVRYDWHANSRRPPLKIDELTGVITVSIDKAFDFESFNEEVFIIEAVDSNKQAGGKSNSAILRLTINDVNDENPQLILPSYRADIVENSSPGEDVLMNIEARDRDAQADLEILIKVITVKPIWDDGPGRECDPVQEEPTDLISWFTLTRNPPVGGSEVYINITVGEVLADREFLDRVELEIIACDKNQIIGKPCDTQRFNVEIGDANDNCPYFDTQQDFRYEVSETEEFPPEGDNENEYQREIIRGLRINDRDLNSNITFKISSDYPGMDDLIEIDNRGVVRRTKDVMIDREFQDFYNGDTDFLHYNYSIFDQVHEVSQNIIIKVIDINDNDPIFTHDNELTFEVYENTTGEEIIFTIHATDKDSIEHYGKVNYDFSMRNVIGKAEFDINSSTGDLTAKRNLIDRERFSEFRLDLEAFDSYPSASGRRSTFIAQITVLDVNDNVPEFLTSNEKTLVKISEVGANIGEPLDQVIQLFDRDDPNSPNSQIVVELVNVECNRHEIEDPISIFEIELGYRPVDGRNLTEVSILPKKDFIDLYGIYKLFFRATDLGEGDCYSENNYTIEITDVNNNPPEFITPNDKCLVIEKETIPKNGDLFDGDGFFIIDKDDPRDSNSQIDVIIRTVTCDNIRVPDLMSLFLLQCVEPEPASRKCDFRANNHFRNRWGTYNLTIAANDRGNPTQFTQINYCIQILDENINEPEFITSNDGFLNSVFETEMEEDKEFDRLIFITDQDEPYKESSNLTVELINSECEGCNEELCPNKDNLFKISTLKTDNGSFETTLLATQNFRNCYGIYSLKFEAVDKGNPPLKSNQTYKIEVRDENLHYPVFVWPPDNQTRINIILENEVGRPIVDDREVTIRDVHATDNDSPTSPNGQLTLEFRPDDGADKFFKFEFANGGVQKIFLIQELQREHLGHNFNSVIRAIDHGEPERFSTHVNLVIHVVSRENTAPFFLEPSLTLKFTENQTELEEDAILAAIDPDFATDTKNDIVYYYITGADAEFFELIPSQAENADIIPLLRAKEQFDREERDLYEIWVYVSNQDNLTPQPPGPIPSPQYLPVRIEIIDIIDTSPVFDDVIDNLISTGFADSTKAQAIVYMFKASDVEFPFGDIVTFEIDGEIKGSTPSLDGIRDKLRLTPETDEGEGDMKRARANLQLAFDALPTHDGHFSFTIKASDSENMETLVPVEIYIFHDRHVVVFNFLNLPEDIEPRKTQLAEILGRIFQFRCNIDRVAGDGSLNQTSVYTHFVDAGLVDSLKIQEMQLDPKLVNDLYAELIKEDFRFDRVSYKNPDLEQDDNLITYILIGGCAVLGVAFVIMSVTCWFRSRGLSRKVRALTASTFGSQASGVNRAGTGGVDLVPGTNVHAIQGSNPVYSGEGESRNPAFDTESIGSGGSVLIGVEDDDDFKNYEEDDNNPPQTSFGRNQRNPLFDPDDNIDFIDMPSTNPVRRNPLMHLDIDPGSGEDASDT